MEESGSNWSAEQKLVDVLNIALTQFKIQHKTVAEKNAKIRQFRENELMKKSKEKHQSLSKELKGTKKKLTEMNRENVVIQEECHSKQARSKVIQRQMKCVLEKKEKLSDNLSRVNKAYDMRQKQIKLATEANNDLRSISAKVHVYERFLNAKTLLADHNVIDKPDRVEKIQCSNDIL